MTPPPAPSPEPAPEPPLRPSRDAARVRSVLRRHRVGQLAAAGLTHRAGLVLHPRSSLVLMPVDRRMLDTDEATLFVPAEADLHAAHAHVEVRAADERLHGDLLDRWAAHHGRADRGVPAVLRILSARLGGIVADADELDLANPLAADEFALVRALNADPAALARACRDALGFDVLEPVAVGVDPEGVDVRTRVGVVRVQTIPPMPDAPTARGVIAAWLRP